MLFFTSDMLTAHISKSERSWGTAGRHRPWGITKTVMIAHASTKTMDTRRPCYAAGRRKWAGLIQFGNEE